MSTVTTAASSPGRAGDQAPAESLVELMHRRLDDAADRRAIVDTLAEAVTPAEAGPGDTRATAWTWGELIAAAVTLADAFAAAGLAPGDRVAHVGPHAPDWILVDFACLLAGVVHVPLHADAARSEQLDQRELYPEKQGFDVNIGGNSSGGPPSYFSPYRNPTLKDGAAGEYLPSRLADEAMNFVRSNRDRPFFLNWWPYSVHYPMQAPEELIAKYRQRKEVKDPVYAAMIEGMDAAIGRFLKQLDEAGLRANTLILFKSDNGGYSGDNRPLRGFKGMLYEGGLRVPWIVRWPGRVPAGSICATPVISTDCHPTLLEAAGLPPALGSSLDGRSLIPLFEQKPGFDRDAIFFHYPNYAFHKKNRLGSAMRAGDFKLITYYDNGELELYRLSSDIGEEENLSQQHPEIVRRLKDKLDAWLRQTDARLPVRKATK